MRLPVRTAVGAALLAAAVAPLAASSPAGSAGRATVQPEVPATATNLSQQRSQNSPTLAVDPTEPRFVALASRVDGPRLFDCLLAVSGDRGRNWIPARPVPTLPEGAEQCYAPEIAFDRTGRLYYLFVGLAGGGNTPMGVFLTSSTDRGRTFSPPRQILGPRKYGVRMAIDAQMGKRGRIHLVWLAPTEPPSLGSLPISDNPIVAAHSDDGGETWTEPVVVSDPGRRFVVAPALVLGPDHAVHVAYYDLVDDRRDYQGLEGPVWEGNWVLVTASSTDGGQRFARGVVAVAEVVPPERVMLIFTMPPPALAADGRGRLHLAWWDARNGDWDVFVTTSPDTGRTWGRPVRVNDDPSGNGRHQYLPRLAVAPGDRLDVIFYDRRDDPDNRMNKVFYASSDDGGATFGPNLAITSVSFPSDTGSRYPIPSAKGLVEYGGRVALVARPDGALAAWTDTRVVPRFYEHQDIFATEIDLASAGTGGRGAAFLLAVAGVAAAFASAAAIAVVRVRRCRPAA